MRRMINYNETGREWGDIYSALKSKPRGQVIRGTRSVIEKSERRRYPHGEKKWGGAGGIYKTERNKVITVTPQEKLETTEHD